MISPYESVYAGLVEEVMMTGDVRHTRNGTVRSVFAKSFSLSSNEIPLLSGRRLPLKSVLGELAAMFRGPKHVMDFKKFGCNYWDSWGDDAGLINVDYGNLWKDFDGTNQIAKLKDSLKNDPYSRRHIVTGWNPANVDKLSLPCCHLMYQWYVTSDGRLDMSWHQRSVDVMLGLPANVILATAWNFLLANELGYKPGKVNFMLGDVHIYEAHEQGVFQYMANVEELGSWTHKYKASKVKLRPLKGMAFEDFVPSMVEVLNYEHMGDIKMECIV